MNTDGFDEMNDHTISIWASAWIGGSGIGVACYRWKAARRAIFLFQICKKLPTGCRLEIHMVPSFGYKWQSVMENPSSRGIVTFLRTGESWLTVTTNVRPLHVVSGPSKVPKTCIFCVEISTLALTSLGTISETGRSWLFLKIRLLLSAW